METEKVRVLQIVNYMYPTIGGVGQVAQDIACCLPVEEFEQRIICFNANAIQQGYETKERETTNDMVDGVPVIRCGIFAHIASQSLSLSYIGQFNTLMNNFKPDIVIFHYPNPYLAFFLLLYKHRNYKLIVYWHSDIIKQKILGKLFYGQNYDLLKRANQIVATSPNYIDGSPFLRRFKDKCVVIPNCVREDQLIMSDDTVQRSRKIRERFPNKIISFALGRHVPYKGFEYLIKASELLDDRFLIFIGGGEGPLTEKLKVAVTGNSRICLTGRLSSADLGAYYEACDIFCFPSITKNEAFGIALADGMFYGKPSVTFSIPGSGVNYVSLNGVTGIECNNCNIKEFAEALLSLADNPELRRTYGLNAKERVKNLFLFDTYKRNIQKLIMNLV